MTSEPEFRSETTQITNDPPLQHCASEDPLFTVSEEAQILQVLNKENVVQEEEEAALKRPYNPSATTANGPPVPKRAAHAPPDHSAAVPMPPPMMRFSTSVAFSDTTFPFSFSSSGRSLGNSAAHMTELLQYTSVSGLYGISPAQFETPMQQQQQQHEASSSNPDPQRRELPLDSDLTMAANALLDLTPSVINQNRLEVAAPHPARTASERRRSISAELEDWGRRWIEPPVAASAPTLYSHKLNIVLRAQELLQDNIPFTLYACHCKSSHCLKLYCNCFQSGTLCDPYICGCLDCENSAAHSVPRGSRTRAIYDILHRRIHAFDPKDKKMGQGCACKKNRYVDYFVIC